MSLLIAVVLACALASAAVLLRALRRSDAALRAARRQASRDELTGVLTRAGFLPLLEQRLRHPEWRETVALLAVDLDDFGKVNKLSGHPEGDRVLMRAAIRLQTAAGAALAVARVGGDEFLVLAAAPHARDIATRIVTELTRAPIHGHSVGASVGIALAPRDGDTAERLLGAADAALRAAKRSGKGRVLVSDGVALPVGRERVAALLAAGGIRIVVQPVVGVDSGLVRGYEALARFDAPRGETPLWWFAAAEEAGMRLELELACLHAALELHGTQPAGTTLSVNASPKLLALPATHQALGRAGDLHGLVVEITEDAIVEDYDALLSGLEPLLRRGLELAVDDLGAGHATMRHVTALRPRYLKLDRSLVRGVDRDPAQAALIDAMLGYAQRTSALLVAEGVESEAELRALQRVGVPLAQGFHLGRPAPPWPGIAPSALACLQQPSDPSVATLPREATAEEAHARFAADPELQAAVVVGDDQTVLGLLTRHRLLIALGRRYGFALYGTKSALAVADRRCLLVPPELAHERLVARAMAREAASRYDPVVEIDEHRRPLRVVTIQRLLEDQVCAVEGRGIRAA